jgi:hypothetical protein
MPFVPLYAGTPLHDSVWVGLFPDVVHPGNTIVGLQWDSLWLPEAIATQLFPESALYLLIKLTGTLGVTFANTKNGHQASDTESFDSSVVVLSQPTRKIVNTELVDLDENRVLMMTDTQGYTVTLVFEGTLTFLAIDSQQRLIPL